VVATRAGGRAASAGVLVLAVVLTLAACGGADATGSSSTATVTASATPTGKDAAAVPTTPWTSATPGTTPTVPDDDVTTIVMTPEPTATAGGWPTATMELSQLPVDVTLVGGAIEPAWLFVRAGEITFAITNNDTIPHTLEVHVPGMILVSPDVAPGASVSWPVRIDTPGIYELYSAIDGVREPGMTATLQVVG
jgi:uncharacterized cupredoxin-like copper-binding protein